MSKFNRKDIIFNVEYHKFYDNNFKPKDDYEKKRFEKSKWQRSNQAVSYITRESACDNKLKDEAKLFNDLLNFTDLEQSDIIKMSKVDYDNEIEKTNGFSSFGDLTKENKLI